ncbi:unnamed protein product [Peniophora sp. CBMAI 1063]|nr:unnamed protein product [Peniophora sp. CBMAI 1063]
MLLPLIHIHYEINLEVALVQGGSDIPDIRVDQDTLASFVATPATAATSLRDSYRGRTRFGTNVGLETRTRALLHRLGFPQAFVPSHADCSRLLRVIEECDVIAFLTEVLSAKDFLNENSTFVIDILNTMYRVFLVAQNLPSPIDARFTALSSAFCDSIEHSHSWFEADRAALAGSPLNRIHLAIRKSLLPNILVLISEGHFLETPGLRRLCLLYWITNSDIDVIEHMTPVASHVMLQYALTGRKTLYKSVRELHHVFRSSINQYILPTYGAERYLHQMAKMLRNKGCGTDNNLDFILPIIVTSIISHPALLASAALPDVLKAMLEIAAQPLVKATHCLERRAVFEFLRLCM